jgi:hypothetical protein
MDKYDKKCQSCVARRAQAARKGVAGMGQALTGGGMQSLLSRVMQAHTQVSILHDGQRGVVAANRLKRLSPAENHLVAEQHAQPLYEARGAKQHRQVEALDDVMQREPPAVRRRLVGERLQGEQAVVHLVAHHTDEHECHGR